MTYKTRTGTDVASTIVRQADYIENDPVSRREFLALASTYAVSYTHLTLPTILLV